jgi:hypothetical protein
MEEMLTLMSRLLVVFPRTIGSAENIAREYRTGVVKLPPAAIRYAVQHIIENDEYFPKVHRIRELAQDYVAKHPVAEPRKPELWCDRCHRLPEWETRWRPVHDGRNRPVLTEDNRHLLIEPYQRLLCKCAETSPFMPEVGVEIDPKWLTERGLQGANEHGSYALMLLSDAPPLVQKRAAGLL